MTRVVFDTNVIVSALLQPLGLPARVLLLFVNDVVQLCVTGDVFAEYEEVLRRPRFRLEEPVIAATLEHVRVKGVWFKVSEQIRACEDADDDIFIECASVAHARYLVTGNVKHFPPTWGETSIVTPRQFLDQQSGVSQ